MLECMYSTGIRVSELVGLNLEDVDFAGSIIRVRGKGRKERLSPMGQTAIAAIQKYLAMRGGMVKDALPTGPLFVNKHGQRLSTRSVRRKLDKYLIEAGLDPDISPHTSGTRLPRICSTTGGPAERAGIAGAPEPEHDADLYAPDDDAHEAGV